MLGQRSGNVKSVNVYLFSGLRGIAGVNWQDTNVANVSGSLKIGGGSTFLSPAGSVMRTTPFSAPFGGGEAAETKIATFRTLSVKR